MTGQSFHPHPNIEATSTFIVELPLSQARLQSDARFPWLVLIPRLEGVRELDQLTSPQRLQLVEEVVLASGAVRAVGGALGRAVEKLNVGELGLVTPQLHVHVIGRRRDDGLWPDPVWGRGPAAAYAPEQLEAARSAALAAITSGRGSPG